jgi:hypothetical protein
LFITTVRVRSINKTTQQAAVRVKGERRREGEGEGRGKELEGRRTG